jgi:hypothetical protein
LLKKEKKLILNLMIKFVKQVVILPILALILLSQFSVTSFAQNTIPQNGTNADTTKALKSTIGFTECTFDKTNASGSVTKCVTQILQFALVIGVFLVVFRIALVGVYQFNPDASVDAQKESVTLVRDLVIGFILIGAPGMFLGLLNAGLINIEFLDFQKSGLTGGDPTKAKPTNTQGTGSGTSGTNGAGGGSASTGTVSVQGINPSDLKQSLKDLKANGTNTAAADKIKKIATLQAQCGSQFVSSNTATDCKILQTTEYQTVLGGITDNIRTSLGIQNIEQTKFSGAFVSQYPMDIQQTSNPIISGGCTTNYFRLTTKTPNGNKVQNAYTKDCGTTPKDSSGLVKNVGGNLNVQTTTIPAGTTFNREISFVK